MALPNFIMALIEADDNLFCNKSSDFSVDFPKYNPETHFLELTKSPHYRALIILRSYVKMASDYYFAVECGAKNVDLFMMTPSVSSPMGPGSDSQAIEIQLGKLRTFLVDSSQFGFEPLLMNGFEILYCYLPSMRGEASDHRHLTQFFHCEAELRGNLNALLPIVEGYIKILSETLIKMPNIISLLSLSPERTFNALNCVASINEFPRISFDEAVDLLQSQDNKNDLIKQTNDGRDITSDGECQLLKLLKINSPLWVYEYDRDRVPFYQKPSVKDISKVINADLLFPPLLEGSFCGEIAGAGERQNSRSEILESLERQGIDPAPYEWYISLRDDDRYQTTSGFGLGIERFITWALCRSDIKEVIAYPRLKDVVTHP